MNRTAFTIVELIFVIVIIGTLSAMAIPKFTGVKAHALRATELSTASAVNTALASIHSAWSMSEEDFDWDNDGADDNISAELTSKGYPKDLSKNGDPLGGLLKASAKSGFVKRKTLNKNNAFCILYTGKASDPSRGVKFPTAVASRDIENKPDKNDFWLYVPEANATTGCQVSSDRSVTKSVSSGDFMLIDINNTAPVDFSQDDLAINFSVTCS